ncbi:hypothetical protein CNR22_20555 [Sphingobacteriaceae bacterium]|nr:hypothetical protein CNR22_20555 [Sphingobacteriaceae bacterium]
MNKLTLLCMLLTLAFVSKAQDQLYKKDNTKLLVKITEVSPEEIKYKLFSNLNGPAYVVNKSEVSLLIYENGQHEVIDVSPKPATYDQRPVVMPAQPRSSIGMTKADSLKYYRHASSLSLNFFNFINSEISLIYQREFYKSNFNIIIPVAFGLDKPVLTESIYYNNGNANLTLNHKIIEAGFGINYYPSLRFPVNYYVGPAFRFLQYDCDQTYYYQPPYNPSNPYQAGTVITESSTLSSYCYSITNGLIFRTKSRLMLNMFGSLGFKSDRLSKQVVDPRTNQAINPLPNPVSLYFWTGFAIGFSF